MTKIFFYFPYNEECGVPVLFLRMARWLSKNHGDKFEIYIVDYEDGAMARNISKNDNIKFLPSGLSSGISIGNGDILIMQSMNPSYFPKELHLQPKAKLFFWTLHFRNLTPSLLPLPGIRDLPFKYPWIYKFCSFFYTGLLHRLSNFINDMIQSNAHYFMDNSTKEQTCAHIKIKQNELDFLPVPATDYNDSLKKLRENPDTINVCWLGRISYEKTPILIHTLERCSEYAKLARQKMLFYVIGSGEFEEVVNNLDIDHNFFTKTKCKSIKFSEIDKFLLNNVDIMFAMGTSALESAKLGIPTVLVDYTATKQPLSGDYRYSYIFNRQEFDLGHLISKEDIEKNNDSLNTIFNELQHNTKDVANKCRNYFVEKHSITKVGDKLYNILLKTNFTYDMIDPKVIKAPYLLSIYNRIRGLKIK